MENALRVALLEWLRSDPSLAQLNLMAEETPLKASLPWLGIASSASRDWGTKDRIGREVQIAFELRHRGDDPARADGLIVAIERRTLALPDKERPFVIVSARFVRGRHQKRRNNNRSTLIEFRFRLLATIPE